MFTYFLQSQRVIQNLSRMKYFLQLPNSLHQLKRVLRAAGLLCSHS